MRLHRVLEAARAGQHAALEREALRLLEEVEAVRPAPDEGVSGAGLAALRGFAPRVRALQDDLGLADHGAARVPRWQRLALWSVPSLALLALLGVVIERRRRKRAVDASALAALAGGEPPA